MEIRKAELSDMREIRRLYRILFRDMAQIQPQFIREGEMDALFLHTMITGEDSDILLAGEAEKVCGFAMVQLRETPPLECFAPHRYSSLIDLAVEPSERGRGIGRQLIHAVKAWSKEWEAEYVELNILSGNEPAACLYEDEGFGECMRTLRAML